MMCLLDVSFLQGIEIKMSTNSCITACILFRHLLKILNRSIIIITCIISIHHMSKIHNGLTIIILPLFYRKQKASVQEKCSLLKLYHNYLIYCLRNIKINNLENELNDNSLKPLLS